MAADHVAFLAVLVICILWIVQKLSILGRRESFLPPGPPTVPVLGNLLIFPTVYPWVKFTEWAREYGDVYSLKTGSSTMIIINSLPAIKEIMEKNSGLVSDRPRSIVMDAVVGENSISFAHYSNGWRALRKGAREILTLQACQNHLGIQRAEASQLMYDLLARSDKDFYTSIRRFSASVIFSVLFGRRAPRFSARDVTEFFESQHAFEQLVEPGVVPPLEVLPILQYVPERWARWKRLMAFVKVRQRALYIRLFEEVTQKVKNGITNGCWMETLIERGPGWGLNKDQMAYLGGVLIEGASDTTSLFLQTTIFALLNFPEAQRRAQQEIDNVIGPNRIPDFTDIDDLPYVRAFIKEVMRWRPIAPVAIPHSSIEDVPYKEHIIPRGATIFVNAWAIFHDPELFDDPSKFDPSRWLKPEMADNKTFNLIFGSARRVCPGQHLARNSINLNTMNFIWAFNFTPTKDPSTGQPRIYDLHDFMRGIMTAPNPFECNITPRSSHHADMIKHAFLDAARDFEPFEHDIESSDKEFVVKIRGELRAGLKAPFVGRG